MGSKGYINLRLIDQLVFFITPSEYNLEIKKYIDYKNNRSDNKHYFILHITIFLHPFFFASGQQKKPIWLQAISPHKFLLIHLLKTIKIWNTENSKKPRL